MTSQEENVRKSVPRNMLLRHAVPSAMLDGDARLLPDRLEPNFDFGVLIARKRRLAPPEDKPAPGFPSAHATDLEDFSVRQLFDEATAFAAFETHDAGAARRKPKQHVGLPPTADFLGKDLEGALGARRHAQSDEDARAGHLRRFDFSICALNDRSCRLQSCSVSSSQNFSASIGAGVNL